MNKTTAPRIAKGAQPSFFDQPALEAMYGMLVVLMEDVCVLQDRLDTYERKALSRWMSCFQNGRAGLRP